MNCNWISGADLGEDLGFNLDFGCGSNLGFDLDLGLNFGINLVSDLGSNPGSDLGVNVDFDLGPTIVSDLGINLGVNLGPALDFNFFGPSFGDVQSHVIISPTPEFGTIIQCISLLSMTLLPLNTLATVLSPDTALVVTNTKKKKKVCLIA